MEGLVNSVLRIEALSRAVLQQEPYTHAVIDELFDSDRARALATTFPTDRYRIVSGGADKLYRYDARPFLAFGRDELMFADHLSVEWQALGRQLVSPAYREALGRLTNLDLSDAPLEVNLFHYGPRCLLEPHTDLPDKIVTHVLYFNEDWDPSSGGCLAILRSSEMSDVSAEIPP